MKCLQVIPRDAYRLFGAMVAEEARLSRKEKGTFRRRGPKRKNSAQWFHIRFGGRLDLKREEGEVVEVKVRSKPGVEWQLLRAILGFIDRHFAAKVRAINIQYGD